MNKKPFSVTHTWTTLSQSGFWGGLSPICSVTSGYSLPGARIPDGMYLDTVHPVIGEVKPVIEKISLRELQLVEICHSRISRRNQGSKNVPALWDRKKAFFHLRVFFTIHLELVFTLAVPVIRLEYRGMEVFQCLVPRDFDYSRNLGVVMGEFIGNRTRDERDLQRK